MRAGTPAVRVCDTSPQRKQGFGAPIRINSTHPRCTVLKLRNSSLIPFRFAIPSGFSYSYSALAVLVLDDTAAITRARNFDAMRQQASQEA
jgi:hypothetical protein